MQATRKDALTPAFGCKEMMFLECQMVWSLFSKNHGIIGLSWGRLYETNGTVTSRPWSVIEIIDLIKTPALAAGDQILAVPTLVRRLPESIKKIIGDLSNEERVLVGLDVQPAKR